MNEGRVITLGTDRCVPSPRIESLAPTLSAKGAERVGHPESCELGRAGPVPSRLRLVGSYLGAGRHFLIFVLQLIELEVNTVLGQQLLV